MQFLWYFLIALIPGIFWLWFYRRQDKKPEPIKLLAKVFILGALITIPAIFIEQFFDNSFFVFFGERFSESVDFFIVTISTLFIVAPVEEYLKYFVVKKTIWLDKEFNQPVDGIIYGVAAALGFATFENVLVMIGEGGEAIILRFATATLMHAITTGIVGFYMGVQKFSNAHQKNYIAQGIIIAIILHFIYNVLALASTSLSLLLLGILLIIMFFMLRKGIKEMQINDKTEEINDAK
ncbi:MAG: PrsW family glutamic-type intramembrane protease [bacterium]